jgi:hypothetical protein
VLDAAIHGLGHATDGFRPAKGLLDPFSLFLGLAVVRSSQRKLSVLPPQFWVQINTIKAYHSDLRAKMLSAQNKLSPCSVPCA